MGIIHSIILLVIFLTFTFNAGGPKVAQYEPYYDDMQEEEEYVDMGHEEIQFQEAEEIPQDYYDEEEFYEVEEAPLENEEGY